MALSKVLKIYMGWAAVISVGICGFVLTRNSVTRNRMEVMKARQRVQDALQADQNALEAETKDT